MSTIYLIDRETTIGDNNIAGGDILGLAYDTSAAAYKSYTASNVQQYLGLNVTPGATTASKPIVTNASNKIDKIDVTTTALIGNFATSLLGFYGATVTVQPAVTVPTLTVATSTTPWGFADSAQFNSVLRAARALGQLGLVG